MFCAVFSYVLYVYVRPLVNHGPTYFISVFGALDITVLVIMCDLLVSLVLVHILPVLHLFQEILGFFNF